MSTAELTFACALPREAVIAKRHGNVELVGLRCKYGIPGGDVIANGFIGSLRRDLRPGTIVTVEKIVSETGAIRMVQPLNIPGAKRITVFGSEHVIRDAATLEKIRQKTNADAVHTEVHRYPNLQGAFFAVTDYPLRPLGELGDVLDANDEIDFEKAKQAFKNAPWQSLCVSVNSLKAEIALRLLVL